MLGVRLNFLNFNTRDLLKIFKKRPRQFGIFYYLYLALGEYIAKNVNLWPPALKEAV